MTPELKSLFESNQTALGFSHFGSAILATPVSLELYEQWLNKKYHGEMQYLENHLPFKKDPKKIFPFAHSAFVFAFPYYPWPDQAQIQQSSTRIALYAQGPDYHVWIAEKLRVLIVQLQKLFPEETFLQATDSKPVLERDLAYRAGLGWVGKNTCLIHPKKGSLFFIAEILTSLKNSYDTGADLVLGTEKKDSNQLAPIHDFCGTCTKCIDICPTEALEEPRVLNATKCISYWTIESKTVPPQNLRSKFGDLFFGCDLCQTVCPWNQKVFQKKLEVNSLQSLSHEKEVMLIEELKFILESSAKGIERKYANSPLARARGFGLKRNALLVIGNRKLIQLRPAVEDLRNKENIRPELSELATWTLQQLQ